MAETENKDYIFITNSGFMAKVLYFQLQANLIDWRPDAKDETKQRTAFVFAFGTKDVAGEYLSKAIDIMRSFRKKRAVAVKETVETTDAE